MSAVMSGDQLLEFVLVDHDGTESALQIPVTRGYNLGFTIRDAAKMQAHIDEVALVGVVVPEIERPPIIFPISGWAWITSSVCPVQTEYTSGEIELLVVDTGDELFVGVGSDHTDRSLESHDIPWSKQVAPNVLAPTLWRWSDVEAHWDECTLESHVWHEGERIRYQSASVAEFWTPGEMAHSVEGRVSDLKPRLMLSGTVVSEGGHLIYGDRWEFQLADPVLGRTIKHQYDVVVLAAEVLP